MAEPTVCSGHWTITNGGWWNQKIVVEVSGLFKTTDAHMLPWIYSRPAAPDSASLPPALQPEHCKVHQQFFLYHFSFRCLQVTMRAALYSSAARVPTGMHSDIIFLIAFITCNSNLVPLLEGLCISNPYRFDFLGFWVFAGIESTTSGLTVVRSDQLS